MADALPGYDMWARTSDLSRVKRDPDDSGQPPEQGGVLMCRGLAKFSQARATAWIEANPKFRVRC
jgi:hypothetical protein